MKVLYICVSTAETSIAAEIARCIDQCFPKINVEIVAAGGDETAADYTIPSLFGPQGLSGLLNVLKGSRPDVVHIHPNAAGVIAALSTRLLTNASIVAHEHTDRSPQNRVRKTASVARDVLADAVISNSNATKSAHESLVAPVPKRFTARQKRIYNGVDLDEIVAQSPSDYGREGVPLLVVASRLAPEKDFETLLKGISKTWAEGYELDVVILGDGPESNRVKSWANKQNDKRIMIPGEVPRDSVWSAFQEADITASASVREGFGVSIVEAMAAGTVPIVTDIPAHREVVGNVGHQFPVGEAGEFADRLMGVLDDREMLATESNTAQKRAEQFALNSTAASHIELYLNLQKS